MHKPFNSPGQGRPPLPFQAVREAWPVVDEADPHKSDCAMRFHPSAECTCGKLDRLAELNDCEACGGDGVLFVSVDGAEPPTGMKFVQKCDLCGRYADDFAAAEGCGRAILAVLVRE